MDLILHTFLEKPEDFSGKYLERRLNDDFSTGLLVALIVQSKQGMVEKLKEVAKVMRKRKDLIGTLAFFLAGSLEKALFEVKGKNLGVYVKDFVDFLELLAFAEGFSQEFGKIASESYEKVKKAFCEHVSLVKIVQCGKRFPQVFPEVKENVLSEVETEKLVSLVESAEIIEGCTALMKICERLQQKFEETLYKIVVSCFVYLFDKKATLFHANQLSYELIVNFQMFLPEDKKKIISCFLKFSEKVAWIHFRPVEDLFMEKISIKNAIDALNDSIRAAENLENFENLENLENPVNKNQEKVKNLENPVNKNPEKVKNLENPLNKNPEIVKNLENPLSKNPEIAKNLENPPIKNPEIVKNLENPPNKNPEILKNLENRPNKNPEILKNLQNPQTENPEDAIQNIIAWSSNLFFENKEIPQNILEQKLLNLNLGENNTLLFEILSEMMEYDETSTENAKFWRNFSPIFEKLPTLSQEQKKSLQKLQNRLEKSSPILSKPQKKFPGPEKRMKDPPQKAAAKIDPMSSEYQALSLYISKLSEDCLLYLRENSMTQEILDEMNASTKHLRTVLKTYSPSAKLSFIGSAAIGTSLKEGHLDLLLTDKSFEVSSYLHQAFPSIERRSESLYFLRLEKVRHGFFIHTKNMFQTEVASLIKKYCLVDSRVNELIMFVKLWAKNWKIFNVSGFEFTLVALVFCLNTDPVLVVNLQQKDHREKIVEGVDVWFDHEQAAVGKNIWNIGQLIYHFFHFFQDFSVFLADLKNGKFYHGDGKFRALHPFTGDIVERVGENDVEDRLALALKESFEMILRNQRLADILKME